ncbi:MAG: hypothetical protein US94_C0035G0007 [Berkelbacteria bacterium GW2011_GWB1_38_5]|uniref:DUF4145 domain-containing protein n=1 Tax=Berkelbacteria bacterium GW2011_GWB1_38_5 TaxID=1618336 RepID=A0A0G0N7W9_9BACT|nr:MAG: hypothetical protein US94_C0035G0007 [Berkelbacteria bacterium GW2011_GWB1_38_5]
MSYRVHQYHSKPSTEEKILTSIGRGLWWVISLPYRLIFDKKTKGQKSYEQVEPASRNYVRNKWMEIEQLLALGKPSNNARAVLEADKLLDHILKGLRTPGLTMGDRLKASHNKFSPEAYDAAWKAHKIRNELVHNSTFELMDFSAKSAISNFEKAIDELTK